MKEMNWSVSLTAEKNGIRVPFSAAVSQNIQTTLGVLHHTEQIVGTSKENLSIGDVDPAAEAVVVIRNTDQANVMSLWLVSQQPPNCYIRPGESFGPVRVFGGQIASWQISCANAAGKAEVVVIEAGDPAS